MNLLVLLDETMLNARATAIVLVLNMEASFVKYFLTIVLLSMAQH